MTSPNTFLQGVGLRVLAIFVLTAMSAAVRAVCSTDMLVQAPVLTIVSIPPRRR